MKKNRALIILNILFLLTTVDLFAGDGGYVKVIKELIEDDFRIFLSDVKYISIDMGSEEIERNLGKPLEILVEKNPYNSEMDEIEYVYDGLSVYFYRKENKINYVYVRNSDYHTLRGVYVGDSVSSIKEKYPIDKIFPSGSLLAQYYIDDGTLRVFNIAFEVTNFSITSIILEVASDL